MIEESIRFLEGKASDILSDGIQNKVDEKEFAEVRELFEVQKDLHNVIRRLEVLRVNSSLVTNYTSALQSVLSTASLAFVNTKVLDLLFDAVYSLCSEEFKHDNIQVINGRGEEIVKEFDS